MTPKKYLPVTAVVFGIGVSPALSADLPVAPEPIDYVRICDSYGARFFYIPGTETCLRIGGRVRADYRFANFGDVGSQWDSKADQSFQFRSRAYVYLDSRTQTELGLLRTYTQLYATYTTGNNIADVNATIETAFVQLGGFTFGTTDSFWDFWTGYSLNAQIETYSDRDTTLLGYSASFGNGVSASIALEDFSGRQATLLSPVVNGYGGQTWPDLVAKLQIDQYWGSAQLMGALHHVRFADNTADGELGWAIGAGVEIKANAISNGTKVALQGAYTDGASVYGTTVWNGWITDAIFDGVTTRTTKTWNIFGGISQDFGDVTLALDAGYHNADAGTAARDFTQWDLSGGLIWSPVPGLDIGAEIQYRDLDFDAASGLADGNQIYGTFRVQRTF